MHRDRSATRFGRQPLEIAAVAPEGAGLTDEQWALERPLLPPRRGGTGRSPNDHRAVLGGILWVARTGSSWREMPEEFGKWESAYRRYDLCQSRVSGSASSKLWEKRRYRARRPKGSK